jgi:hypothetical protein
MIFMSHKSDFDSSFRLPIFKEVTRRSENFTVTGRRCDSVGTGTGYLQLRSLEARNRRTEISGLAVALN